MRSEAATAPVVDWILAELRAVRAAYDFDIAAAVPRDLLTTKPDGAANSIAWLTWHLARIEDVAINTVVRGEAQVLLSDGWARRIGVDDARVGTGFTDQDVRTVTEALDVDGLDAYWSAVRETTVAWLGDTPDLHHVPDVSARLAAAPLTAPREGAWLAEEWTGRPARYFLRHVVIAHGYVHLGEMRTIRGRLGIEGL